MKNRIWKQMTHVVMAALFLVWAFCSVPVRAEEALGATESLEPSLTPILQSAEVPPEPTEVPLEPTKIPLEPTEVPPEPTEVLPEPTEVPPEPTEVPPEPTEVPPEPTEIPSRPTSAPTPAETPESIPTPTITPLPTTALQPEILPALALELYTDSGILKAGTEVLYQVKILNEGNVPLEHISLESRFSCPKIQVDWEAAQGLAQENQGENRESGKAAAILEYLAPGEERTLHLHAVLTEEQSQKLTHTVTAWAISPGSAQETILEEAVLETEVEPLKIDFTVEKTADRAIAVPGDLITYWICIRNTGERTLHSVASTERFLGSDIQARFEEQEGIILNGAGTQALISRISPGDAVNLKASVLVPKEAAGQELINEVTVRTEETGEHSVSAQSSVIIGVPEPEITQEPGLLQTSDTKENPKTGDASPTAVFAGLMCASMTVSGLLGAWRKAKRRR
jgi:hypothetical protein